MITAEGALMPGSSKTARAPTGPAVSDILDQCEIWEMTLPWLPMYWDMDILRRYRSAGYNFVSATLQDWPATLAGTWDCIQEFERLAAVESDWLQFGSSLAAIEEGRAAGKLTVGFNSQDSTMIAGDLANIAKIGRLGIRHMQLSYNTRNELADGCAESSDAGLSNFGRLVVREMNEARIILDCSHAGRRSSLEAMALTALPPIFSHSNPYALCPHIRNITDEQIRACANRDGVIGIVGIGSFLGDAAARSATLFRHIDYVAQLVGPRHVGLGTDYVKDMHLVWESMLSLKETAWPDPTGTQLYEGSSFQPEQLGELLQIMLDNGYDADSIAAILGGNFKRIYAIAEAAS